LLISTYLLFSQIRKPILDTVNDTRLAADWLYRTGEEMRYELQQGMETAKEEIKKIMESLHNNVSKLTEAAARPTSGNTGEATHHDPPRKKA